MNQQEILDWLLESDVAIQYQVHRDLLDNEKKNLQDRIATEGWGKDFLSKKNPNGHWGMRFYQPKWISTHYTLLDLRNINLSPNNSIAKDAIELTLNKGKALDGGIPLGPSTLEYSDICVNGMFLNYASYFNTDEQKLESIVDGLLKEIMSDGGFNCRSTRSGATHSSLHTTLSVLEGINGFLLTGYTYRKNELLDAKKKAEEFILIHQLFLSDRTGKIIHKEFLKLTHPNRWKFNILRAMDYFQYAGLPWDDRMQPALDVILSKRRKNGTWNVQAAYPGQVHFTMEKAGKPSKWNTLRVLRILKHYDIKID